jgi:hypothetical protein
MIPESVLCGYSADVYRDTSCFHLQFPLGRRIRNLNLRLDASGFHPSYWHLDFTLPFGNIISSIVECILLWYVIISESVLCGYSADVSRDKIHRKDQQDATV